MEKPSERSKPTLISAMTRHLSGPLTGVALSALSGWMIVTGLKGLAGFEVNSRTALTDLIGIGIVIAVARWAKARGKSR